MNSTQDTREAAVNHTPPPSNTYINNPFFVATKGIALLFRAALSVGIFYSIISVLSVFQRIAEDNESFRESLEAAVANNTEPFATNEVILGVVIFIALIVVAYLLQVIVSGIADYTSAKLAKGEKTTLGEAFMAVIKNIWHYALLQLLIDIRLFLWTLLFVVPGVIKFFRYSLAGVAFFDKGLKGSAAINESRRLTKGGLVTMIGSYVLINLVTLGFIAPITVPSVNAILYRQFNEVGDNKPSAHILSWLSAILLFMVCGLIIAGLLFLLFAIANILNSGL